MRLALPGVSARLMESAVGLQLARLSNSAALGYCWRVNVDAQVEVWYWDESPAAHAGIGPADAAHGQPSPETLLRSSPPPGLSLVRCKQGLEAIYCVDGEIEKTRWFHSEPTEVEWAWFVQDAGLSPAEHQRPEPLALQGSERPAPGWSFHTSLRRPLSRLMMSGAVVTAILGSVAAAAMVYDLQLTQAIDRIQIEHARLTTDSASAVKLQSELDAIVARVSVLSAERPRVLQLQAMARLANSGLVDDVSKVALIEWEFRNDRLRMHFSVPQEKFVLSEFLAGIERLGVFSEIRLLPGTPNLTVGLQAGLKPALPIHSIPPPDATVDGDRVTPGSVGASLERKP
ncbi:MAG: hypothetical protein KF796_06600 [Ramlibacter sp.]|nr:hypothetical protein [Ramlibacter sp.]